MLQINRKVLLFYLIQKYKRQVKIISGENAVLYQSIPGSRYFLSHNPFLGCQHWVQNIAIHNPFFFHRMGKWLSGKNNFHSFLEIKIISKKKERISSYISLWCSSSQGNTESFLSAGKSGWTYSPDPLLLLQFLAIQYYYQRTSFQK